MSNLGLSFKILPIHPFRVFGFSSFPAGLVLYRSECVCICSLDSAVFRATDLFRYRSRESSLNPQSITRSLSPLNLPALIRWDHGCSCHPPLLDAFELDQFSTHRCPLQFFVDVFFNSSSRCLSCAIPFHLAPNPPFSAFPSILGPVYICPPTFPDWARSAAPHFPPSYKFQFDLSDCPAFSCLLRFFTELSPFLSLFMISSLFLPSVFRLSARFLQCPLPATIFCFSQVRLRDSVGFSSVFRVHANCPLPRCSPELSEPLSPIESFSLFWAMSPFFLLS